MGSNQLCLCLLDNVIYAYQSDDWQDWSIINIKGEQDYHHKNDEKSLKIVLEECDQFFNHDERFKEIDVLILYAQKQQKMAKDLIKLVVKDYQSKSFECLSAERIHQLCEQAGGQEILPFEQMTVEWIQHNLLNLLNFQKVYQQISQSLSELQQREQAFDEQQQAKLQQLGQQEQVVIDQKQQQSEKLDQDIKRKQQELVLIQAPNIESLCSFLPSIFKNFWNQVRPDELANIAGLLTPPQIPSPIQNPTKAAIQSKKRQFLLLSQEEQNQIVGFCQVLKQDFDLEVTLEFDRIIGDLD